MAARMLVEERTYRSWEKGKTAPTVDQLQLLADSFGVSLNELLHLDPGTGAFPVRQPSSQSDTSDRLAVALLNDPDIPTTIKDRVVKIWKEVFRKEGP